MKRVLNVFIDILVVLVFLVSLTVVALSLTSRSTGVPNLLGYTMLSVQTDSMEPTIMTGDLIISHMAEAGAEFEVGDVITYNSYVDNTRVTITHRIVDKKEVNGSVMYSTKGDNAPGWDAKDIVSGDVIALWTGTRLPAMGTVMTFLGTQRGFFLCVLLPMILFFLYMLYNFIMNLVDYNKEKAVDAAKEAAAAVALQFTEEQKRKAIEEYLAAQKAKDDSQGGNK